jgi:hypothetical protein
MKRGHKDATTAAPPPPNRSACSTGARNQYPSPRLRCPGVGRSPAASGCSCLHRGVDAQGLLDGDVMVREKVLKENV